MTSLEAYINFLMYNFSSIIILMPTLGWHSVAILNLQTMNTIIGLSTEDMINVYLLNTNHCCRSSIL